ncbi:hypothetical protein Moror_12678 [Moniliophthora roreri MCA 2997]|nr:hypothetical protein Moror_12678 [Moniliophthora roreri MCA 2997]
MQRHSSPLAHTRNHHKKVHTASHRLNQPSVSSKLRVDSSFFSSRKIVKGPKKPKPLPDEKTNKTDEMEGWKTCWRIMGEASKEEAQKSRWRMPWWLVEKPDLQEPQPQSQGKTPEERVLETPPNLPMIDFKRLPSRITFRKHSKPNLDHSESASMSESQSHSDIAPDEDLTFSSELPPLSSDTSRDAIFPASACPSPNETAPSTSPTSISTHYALPPKMKRKGPVTR